MFDTFGVRVLDCAGRRLVLDRPRIMGVVNATPDSFFDGGLHSEARSAIEHGLRLVREGADLLDIGGESTRPGAAPVSAEEELRRVIPVIAGLVRETSVPIAIDTSKPEVMRAAVEAGAGLINDIYALRQEGALATAAALGMPVCLMHMQGDPVTMQNAPQYDDVTMEVHRFLTERLFACELAGIAKQKIVVDPGFGFGKTLQHNLVLLRQLSRLGDLQVPVLAGLSRKAMIGTLTGRSIEQRLSGSLAAALIAVQNGAAIVRVHDVSATRDVLAVWQAVAAQPSIPTAIPTRAKPVWPEDD